MTITFELIVQQIDKYKLNHKLQCGRKETSFLIQLTYLVRSEISKYLLRILEVVVDD